MFKTLVNTELKNTWEMMTPGPEKVQWQGGMPPGNFASFRNIALKIPEFLQFIDFASRMIGRFSM